jgi:hypothetical protein
MIARTQPGRFSTRCLNVSSGMAAHSSCRAVARAVNDVGRWSLEQTRHSNSSHRCSIGFRSGLWAGQSISGAYLTNLALWQGALSCRYRQSSSPNWSSTVDSTQRVKMSLYPSTLKISVQYYERAKPIPWKTPPHCNATSSKFHCWHYTCWQVSVRQAFATPKSSHMIAAWYSMIHHPKSHVSRCPLSSGVSLYTILGCT